MFISVGVGGLVVLLIAVALVLTSVTVCLRQRYKKKLLITSSNVAYTTSAQRPSPNTPNPTAYGTRTEEVELKDNEAYSTATMSNGGEVGKYACSVYYI